MGFDMRSYRVYLIKLDNQKQTLPILKAQTYLNPSYKKRAIVYRKPSK